MFKWDCSKGNGLLREYFLCHWQSCTSANDVTRQTVTLSLSEAFSYHRGTNGVFADETFPFSEFSMFFSKAPFIKAEQTILEVSEAAKRENFK